MALTSDRQQFQVLSVRDPIHPALLCTMAGAGFRFISGTEIGYAAGSSLNDPIRSVIGRIGLSNLTPVAVVEVQGDVMDFEWSPDGSNLAYLLYTAAPGVGSGAANQLWLKTGTSPPRAITPPIPLYGRGGSLDDQIHVHFSNDGKYLLMIDTFVAIGAPASPDMSHLQVHSIPDGNFVWAAPAGPNATIGKYTFTTMAAWSRKTDRLYYRDQDGVHTWDPPKTVGTMSATLSWYSPSVSPDGRLIAYAVNMRDQPHVEVRDLATGDVRVIRGTRGSPFFVADSMLYVAEYVPSTQQGPGSQLYEQSSRAFVIDLHTIVETAAAMLNPIDSWPR
jgi:hypothetical protein